MSKQIIYPRLTSRLFSSMIDACILMFLLQPLMNYLARLIYLFKFHKVFIANNIDVSNISAMQSALKDVEFIAQINLTELTICVIILNLINVALMGAYFVFFWHKFKATPGKFIMCMRVVQQDNHKSLTIKQAIKRFCSYITALIGIWSIAFHKKGLALHDKITNTVVIKS